MVSGDVSDDGSDEGLSAVRERVAAFARSRGIPQVYCMGNHDDRSAFRRTLGTGHLSAAGTDVGSGWSGSSAIAATSVHDGLRVITLDSVVPGEVHGELTREQTAWLSEVLAGPAPRGSVVVLHHPPFVPDGSVFFSRAALRRPERLAEALVGSDVRVVLCGHFHAPGFGVLAGVPSAIAPAVVWRIDSAAPRSVVRGVGGGGAAIIDLGDAAARVQLVWGPAPGSGQAIFELDAVTLQPLAPVGGTSAQPA